MGDPGLVREPACDVEVWVIHHPWFAGVTGGRAASAIEFGLRRAFEAAAVRP